MAPLPWLDGDKIESGFSRSDNGRRRFVFESNDEELNNQKAILPLRRPAFKDEVQIISRRPSIYQELNQPNQTAEGTDEHEHEIDIHDNGKNATIHLDIDVQIDLAEDVAELARLNRLGWFKQGVILYEEKLKNHLDCFPVVVEYADLLLQQGEYKKALSFTEYCCALHDRTETYAPDEYIVLKSMNAYAAIFATGTVDPAVEALKRMLEYLRREGVESLKATKIHMVELYFQISIFIHDNTRRYPTFDYMHFGSIVFKDSAWFFLPMSLRCCYRLGDWYRLLREQGFYWESFRFLQLVLAILNTDGSPLGGLGAVLQISSRDSDFEDAFFTLGQITSYGDEQLALAELASISSIGCFIMDTSPHHYLHAAKICWYRERSLARLILDKYAQLSTSRPFLEWILKEHVRHFPFQTQLTAQLRSDLPNLITQKRQSIKSLLDEILGAGTMKKVQEKDNIEGIQKVLKCSEESGDTLLQRRALQELIMFTGNTVSSRLQSLRTLSNLLDTVDLVGYIEYLVIKYTVLQDIAPDTPQDMQATEKFKLCEEIRRFNLRYPWDNAFSLPLSEYIKDKVYMRVLTDLHRESELFPIERILKGLKRQLPIDFESGRNPWAISDSESDESDIEEEVTYRPRSANYRVTRRARSLSPTNVAVRDIEEITSPIRLVTIRPKSQKSGVGQGDEEDEEDEEEDEDEEEVEEEAGKIEKSNHNPSGPKQRKYAPSQSSFRMPPGSSSEYKENAYEQMSPSHSETENKRNPDESKSIQDQERYQESAALSNRDKASITKLNRQPTIELASEDSKNKNSGMWPMIEQVE